MLYDTAAAINNQSPTYGGKLLPLSSTVDGSQENLVEPTDISR